MKRLLLVALAVMVAVGVWSAAYGNEPSKVISGTVDIVSKTQTPYVYEKSVNFDGIGRDDYSIRVSCVMAKYTGLMEGYGTNLLTTTRDLLTGNSRGSGTMTFWGTVG